MSNPRIRRRASLAQLAGFVTFLASAGAPLASTPSDVDRNFRLLEVGRSSGLESGQVHAVAEDRRGLLWFALPAGLARFDGRHVTSYGREQGLATQGLRALRAAAGGSLWIGSDLGLELRRPDGQIERIAVGESWGAGAVQDLAIASDGSVWVAAAGGARRCFPRGVCETPTGFSAAEFVSALAVAKDGRVWLASLDSGLHVLESDGRVAESLLGELPVGRPSALLATRAGGMIVAGPLGLVELSASLDPVRVSRRSRAEGLPRALLAVDDELWVGSDRGLATLGEAQGEWVDLGWVMRDVTVNHLLLDASGSVWIGTDSRGVFMVSALRRVVSALALPCETQVFALALASDEVLVGGDQCSARLSLVDHRTQPIAGLRGVKVWDLMQGRDGSLWAATESGLLRSSSNSEEFEPFGGGPDLLAHRTRALLEQDEHLYVAGVMGLARVSGREAVEVLDDEGRSLGYVYTLARQGDRVLAGTLGRGLWAISGVVATPYRLPGLRDDANVYAIHCPESAECAVVQDDELVLLGSDRTRRFEPPMASPIAGWSVRYDGRGDLWLGSTSGLVRYRPPDPAPRQRLTRSMGLPGEEFTTSRSLLPLPDGTLLCGLDGGLGHVIPRELERFDRLPTVELLESTWRDARLDRKGEEIEVDYGRWALDLMLFSSWHLDPGAVTFHYRLDGLEDRWNQVEGGSDRIRFAALPPGRYRLLAQASSPLTGAGPVASLIEFRVGSPWWLSAQTLALVVCLGLILGTTVWRWRVAAIRARTRRVEAVVAKRTEELRGANAELERMAHHDALTGLPNRRLFEQRGQEFVALASRRGESFGLALIDLDRFKAINDQLGHDAGDEALRQVARTLAAAARRGDFFARLAGEEFVVLLAHGPGSDFAAAADRLRHAIEIAPVRFRDGSTRSVTASVGWSAWRPEDGDLTSLLRRADAALYRAKGVRNAVEGDFAPEAGGAGSPLG